ncbi:MAG TPA: DUF3493 domain-containing protein [Thermosynechococcaceae cyanobacterium]
MPAPQKPSIPPGMDAERFARLKAEAESPYRGLRRFVYLSFAASGAIGGFIFLMQVLAGRDVVAALPNLGVQVGVVALMVWLLRLEKRSEARRDNPNQKQNK